MLEHLFRINYGSLSRKLNSWYRSVELPNLWIYPSDTKASLKNQDEKALGNELTSPNFTSNLIICFNKPISLKIAATSRVIKLFCQKVSKTKRFLHSFNQERRNPMRQAIHAKRELETWHKLICQCTIFFWDNTLQSGASSNVRFCIVHYSSRSIGKAGVCFSVLMRTSSWNLKVQSNI